jgi:hypothetical protein
MNNVRNWPTPKLLSLLPHASGVLRERIEAQLKVRHAGTQIHGMPCIKITDTTRALTFARGNYSDARVAEEGLIP